jgi:hypothetical protein
MGHLCIRKSSFDKHWCTTFDHTFNATIYMHIHPKKLYVYPNMTKFKKNKMCMKKNKNYYAKVKQIFSFSFQFYNDEFDHT